LEIWGSPLSGKKRSGSHHVMWFRLWRGTRDALPYSGILNDIFASSFIYRLKRSWKGKNKLCNRYCKCASFGGLILSVLLCLVLLVGARAQRFAMASHVFKWWTWAYAAPAAANDVPHALGFWIICYLVGFWSCWDCDYLMDGAQQIITKWWGLLCVLQEDLADCILRRWDRQNGRWYHWIILVV